MNAARHDAQTLDESVVADFAELGVPGEDVLAELIDVFAEDAADQARAIVEATRTEAWAETARLAHGLKSAAAALGAERTAAMCLDIELAGSRGEGDGLAEDSAALVAEVDAAISALRAYHARTSDT